MEKKFTRAMVCEEFKSTCGKCPLHSSNNPKSLPCWFLGESDIQDIMKDYPYVDVKVRMIFNDIETRLTKLESYVKPEVIFDVEKMKVLGDEIGIISGSYVDEKLYNKLEAKHEADCRLISEYDLEIKRLEKRNMEQNDTICDLYSKYVSEEKEHLRCEAVIKDLRFCIEKAKDWEKRYKELEYIYEKKNEECNNLEDRYRIHIADLKNKLFELKNVENERDHYKGLYSSKCDDYDTLLEKLVGMEKERDEWIDRAISAEKVCNEYKISDWKKLFENLNHKYQKVVGEMNSWKEKYESINIDYIALEKDYNTVFNTKNSLEIKNAALETENKALTKAFEHVTEDRDKLNSECYIVQQNLKIAKDRLEKLKKENKNLTESNNNHATDNVELEGKLEEKSLRIASLESKLRNQRANLTSLQEKYEDAVKMNKARENVYYANIKLQKTIEAKDREIDLLRSELDKYKTDDECDDSWID